MSERDRGGGTPGNPPRISGIPSNAHFHELAEFRTLNAQRPRPSIESQEMAWCQNMMPIGAYYCRSLPDAASAIFGSPAPPPEGVKFTGTGLLITIDGITNGRILVQPVNPGPVYISQNVGTAGPLTTTKHNDLLILFTSAELPVTNPYSTPVITSVTSTSGLNWQRRGGFGQILADSESSMGPQIYAHCEMWYAPSFGVLTNEHVTITYNQNVRSAIFGVVGVNGINLDDIWDTSGAQTNFNNNNNNGTSTPVLVNGINTTNNNDIAIGWFAGYTNPVFTYALPTTLPWHYLAGGTAGNGGGTFPGWADSSNSYAGGNSGLWNQALGFYNIVSGAQSGYVVPSYGAAVSETTWMGIADAAQGYPTGQTSTILTSEGMATLPANADTLLIAGWIGFADGTINILQDIDTAGVQLSVTLSSAHSVWSFSAKDSGGATIVSGNVTISGDISGPGYHSFAVSARMSTHTLQILVDSILTDASGLVTWHSTNPVAYPSSDDWQVGPVTDIAYFSSLWFAPTASFFDLSHGANVQTLFGQVNCFLDWGNAGQAITGSQPPLFLYGDAGAYPNNLGSGGSFTLTGYPLVNEAGPIACP